MIKGYKLLGIQPLDPNKIAKVVCVKNKLSIWQKIMLWIKARL